MEGLLVLYDPDAEFLPLTGTDVVLGVRLALDPALRGRVAATGSGGAGQPRDGRIDTC
ncbi:MAG TPA: hypothetical protein VN458_09520 [Solirubrobacterales bacterium]|nr:hypothetical protein [Solirubrobacterales bacterium]